MDGGKHCRLKLSDGIDYKGVIRGGLKKKHIFIKNQSYVLVERRDFQDGKVDWDRQVSITEWDMDIYRKEALVELGEIWSTLLEYVNK